ncbi:hypothetical protein [Nonomuraea gerenzanensis]|uniref:Uncharacterized protein n=1 Tax=Nonomuraea gerenzanensis TaxID=93944 RepID=A0A1M4DWU5_9ACTN|nr:hypothetical protein [Nonomuraea gerenzanensis]UBU13343.1 hypothetical protein LCN96_55480 [Nonomuraea gerenzanensis]SBO91001.1 hypothetical protein BN4615_P515 [Nonomuraea gerenzanensis]
MRGLLGFLPWIVYAFVATGDEWRWGAITGLVIAVVLVGLDRRAGKGWDEIVIEASAAVFFACLTVFALVVPHSPLTPYGPALVNLWLAGTAWGSLVIRRPFTLGIARTMAPRDIWESPWFHRVNAVITTVWAAAFTVAALCLAFVPAAAPHATALVIAIKALSFALPALFAAWYPKRARRALIK